MSGSNYALENRKEAEANLKEADTCYGEIEFRNVSLYAMIFYLSIALVKALLSISCAIEDAGKRASN